MTDFKKQAEEILSKTIHDEMPAFTSSLTDNEIEKFSPLVEQALRGVGFHFKESLEWREE